MTNSTCSDYTDITIKVPEAFHCMDVHCFCYSCLKKGVTISFENFEVRIHQKKLMNYIKNGCICDELHQEAKVEKINQVTENSRTQDALLVIVAKNSEHGKRIASCSKDFQNKKCTIDDCTFVANINVCIGSTTSRESTAKRRVMLGLGRIELEGLSGIGNSYDPIT